MRIAAFQQISFNKDKIYCAAPPKMTAQRFTKIQQHDVVNFCGFSKPKVGYSNYVPSSSNIEVDLDCVDKTKKFGDNVTLQGNVGLLKHLGAGDGFKCEQDLSVSFADFGNDAHFKRLNVTDGKIVGGNNCHAERLTTTGPYSNPTLGTVCLQDDGNVNFVEAEHFFAWDRYNGERIDATTVKLDNNANVVNTAVKGDFTAGDNYTGLIDCEHGNVEAGDNYTGSINCEQGNVKLKNGYNGDHINANGGSITLGDNAGSKSPIDSLTAKEEISAGNNIHARAVEADIVSLPGDNITVSEITSTNKVILGKIGDDVKEITIEFEVKPNYAGDNIRTLVLKSIDGIEKLKIMIGDIYQLVIEAPTDDVNILGNLRIFNKENNSKYELAELLENKFVKIIKKTIKEVA